MKPWDYIFLMPIYTAGYLMLRFLVPLPLFLSVLLCPMVASNIFLAIHATVVLWKVRQEFKEILAPQQQMEISTRKN